METMTDKTFTTSKPVADWLKEQVPIATDTSTHPMGIHSICSFGSIAVYESPIFPFEIKYDACCLDTREEIKIPSGEWIHGYAAPADFGYKEFEAIHHPTRQVLEISERYSELLFFRGNKIIG